MSTYTDAEYRSAKREPSDEHLYQREKRAALKAWGLSGRLRADHARFIDALHAAGLNPSTRPFMMGPREIQQARERLPASGTRAQLLVLEEAYVATTVEFAGRCPEDMARDVLNKLRAEVREHAPELMKA